VLWVFFYDKTLYSVFKYIFKEKYLKASKSDEHEIYIDMPVLVFLTNNSECMNIDSHNHRSQRIWLNNLKVMTRICLNFSTGHNEIFAVKLLPQVHKLLVYFVNSSDTKFEVMNGWMVVGC